jgi:hypothetical protein
MRARRMTCIGGCLFLKGAPSSHLCGVVSALNPLICFILLIERSYLVHLNESDFPEPDEFRPERFLEDRDYPGPFGHSAFGWGRRICPGMHLGSASVELNIARTLWGFNIRPAKDIDGKDVDVDM